MTTVTIASVRAAYVGSSSLRMPTLGTHQNARLQLSKRTKNMHKAAQKPRPVLVRYLSMTASIEDPQESPLHRQKQHVSWKTPMLQALGALAAFAVLNTSLHPANPDMSMKGLTAPHDGKQSEVGFPKAHHGLNRFASSAADFLFPPYAWAADTIIEPVLDSEHQLLDEVWKLVHDNALDVSYNSQDWDLVRTQAREKILGSRKDTYSAIRSMLSLLGDKYTRFVDPEAFSQFSKYDITGSGLLLMPDRQGHLLVAAPPRKDSAAGSAGLERGDFVLEIEGVPTAGLTPYEVAVRLSGEEGTVLKMKIFQPFERKQDLKAAAEVAFTEGVAREVNLVRHFSVKDPVSEYSMVETRGTKVGYIRLTEFNASCTNSVRHALEDLQKQGAQEYVLDLRNNPGGVLEGAVEIAGLFIEPGKVAVHVLDRHSNSETFNVTPSDISSVLQGHSISIVTNGRSASSSEVLAGALQDHCRGVTVGSTTYGKGVVQGVYGLSDGSGLVLTVAKYQTPNHREIQGLGIQPDIPMRVSSGFLKFNPSRIDFLDVDKRLKLCSTTTGSEEAANVGSSSEKTISVLPAQYSTASLVLFETFD